MINEEHGFNEGELVRRMLHHVARGRQDSRMRATPLWSLVKDYCQVGSNSAYAICRAYGLDPDKAVKP